MNLKSKLKNKTILVAFIGALIGFIYQVLGIFGVVAPISQDIIVQGVGIIINLLTALGVIVNPTTPGITDGE